MPVLTPRALRLVSTTTRATQLVTRFSRPQTEEISAFQRTIREVSTKAPSMTTSIPLASLGARADVAKEIQSRLLPEYDLVHMCLSPDSAITELPGLCTGGASAASVISSSGLGSNVSRPDAERRVPRGIIFGGGIGEEDVARVMDAVHREAPGIKAVRVTRDAILATGAQRPSPEIITRILREKLGAMIEEGEL
ncbi:hypothetical protein VTI28DRAFT_9175 [Corynascus sepedonium]